MEDIYAPDDVVGTCSASIEILEDISLGNIFRNIDANADVNDSNVDVNVGDVAAVNESTGAVFRGITSDELLALVPDDESEIDAREVDTDAHDLSSDSFRLNNIH